MLGISIGRGMEAILRGLGKVVIVTGANTGIGKETARGLAAQGARVILAVRDLDKGEAARADIVDTTGNADVDVLPLDLASKRSIRAFVQAFRTKYDRLDVLVNNAGVWTRERQTTEDGFERTFGVNHLGTFLLTNELVPLLEKSTTPDSPSRIVVVSSRLHYRGRMVWDDLQFERRSYRGVAAYNQSKLANVLFTKALARRLARKGIVVNALHPGAVATDLTRELPLFVRKVVSLFILTPTEGAQTSLHLALADECATKTALYFENSREREASKHALDESAQERLWKISEELLADRFPASAVA